MKTQAKSKAYPVSSFIQRSFIIILLINLGLSVVQIVSWIANQYPSNHNLSGFLLISVETILVPILLFCMAFFSNKQSGVRQGKIFEASLFTLVGILISGIVNQIPTLPFIRRFVNYGNSYWSSVMYSLGLTAIGVLMYAVGLAYYRRSQKA